MYVKIDILIVTQAVNQTVSAGLADDFKRINACNLWKRGEPSSIHGHQDSPMTR